MKKILISLTMLASSVLYGVIAEPLQAIAIEAMREKISSFGQGNSFAYVDLGLTKEDTVILGKINFNNVTNEQVQYDRFGDLHLLKDELYDFLISIGNNDEEVIETVTEIISRSVDRVTKASNKNSAWVCVRASAPTDEYDTPRWHSDGSYYGPFPHPDIVFKFAAVLKGPPTLLYNLPDDMRDTFNSNWNNREFLSELLDLSKSESPKSGEGVLFIVGDSKRGAIHSEPKIDENRLFFSILIGDESEISELHSRWRR